MNKWIGIGRVGKDPEIKTFENGNQVCKFSLATSESYKNKDGEKVTETEWHNLSFSGKQCDILEKWVHKGDLLAVEGKKTTRQYDDKNGVTHYPVEMKCNKFEFISSPKKTEQKLENKEGQYQGSSTVSDVNDLPGANDKNEDDLPF